MSPPEEEGKGGAGVEGTKKVAGGVLHQRRNLPFSPMIMAVGGLAIVAVIGYFTLYAKKKPDATARDVAKLSTNNSDSEATRPRK